MKHKYIDNTLCIWKRKFDIMRVFFMGNFHPNEYWKGFLGIEWRENSIEKDKYVLS